MKKVRFVIVILVYRNIEDLEECLFSIQEKIPDHKSIVVNSYYDEESKNKAWEVAQKYDSDFINTENKGYSFGNNKGIEYALQKYNFDSLIVSNPDIVIQSFFIDKMQRKYTDVILAPTIITASGKNQNPMAVKKNRGIEYIKYLGFKKDCKWIVYFGILLSKISRSISVKRNQLKGDKDFKIYAAHGSFVILGKEALEKLYPIYDEKMFLFAEENVLAYKAREKNIETYFTKYIVVKHKEDGSMKLSDLSLSSELRKSNIYYYETYIKK